MKSPLIFEVGAEGGHKPGHACCFCDFFGGGRVAVDWVHFFDKMGFESFLKGHFPEDAFFVLGCLGALIGRPFFQDFGNEALKISPRNSFVTFCNFS